MVIAYPTEERVLLKGHTPLSKTTIHTWPAILFGTFLLLGGTPAFFIGLGIIDYQRATIHAPPWVIALSAGCIMGGGLWLIIHGVVGLRRVWNMEHGKKHLPATPWFWDYSWSARGISDNKLTHTLHSCLALIILLAFLAPFNWVAFYQEQDGFFWQGIVGFLDFVIVVGVGSRMITSFKQYLSFGNPRLLFNDFPYILGNPMSLTLESTPTDILQLQLTLRCIEESYEIHGTGRDRKSVVVCYQIYHDSQTIQTENFLPGGPLSLTWTLPDDTTFASTPCERPAKFWELEITGKGSHVDYESRFLLPIYA